MADRTLFVSVQEPPGTPPREELDVDAVVIDKHTIRLCRNGAEDEWLERDAVQICVVPS